ncbi:MAG: tRNA (guanosine(46)-N7)-methyltransferase TrmB [Ginsengibacter sp.]
MNLLLAILIFAAMGQKKLKRFGEIKTFSNVLEYPEDIAGKWYEHFKNSHPIILELACGKGEYATGLAQLNPENNYIGVDVKGNRIWVGAKFALENKLTNVAFLRTQIHQINSYFEKDEVAEIWITFPDPQLRISKANKRLTHPRYLRLYHQFLKQGGKIHLKTDSPDLYSFTKAVVELCGLDLIADIKNIHHQKNISPELLIKTHYEKLDIAKSNSVFYLCFSLPDKMMNIDDELEHALKIVADEQQ